MEVKIILLIKQKEDQTLILSKALKEYFYLIEVMD